MKAIRVYGKRTCLIGLYIGLILSVVGCQYQSRIKQSTDVETKTKDGESSLVPLKMLVIGSEPIDFSMILTEVNKILNNEIGVDLEVEFLEEEDLASKYHAVFAGGADFDLIQVFPYHYNQYVAKAAYMNLTDDMLKKCAPYTYSQLKNTIFKEVRVNGQLYMIPSSGYLSRQQVLLIRSDLLQESGLTQVETATELEGYLRYIKENITGVIPMDIGYNAYDLFDFMYGQSLEIERYDDALLMVDYQGNEPKVFWLPETDLFRSFLDQMKYWSDENYIPANASSKKHVSKESFIEGRSGAYLGDVYTVESLRYYMNKGEDEFDTKLVTLGNPLNQVRYPIDHGIAVKNGTTNAAKSLMVIEELNTNEAIFQLLNYGIKGIHYTLSEEGRYKPLAMSYRYPIYYNYIWFMNKDFKIPYTFSTSLYIENQFTPNRQHRAVDMGLDKIKLDAMNNVNKNLLYPITFGQLATEDNLKKYAEEMEKAGYRLYYEEVARCINY